MSPPPKDRFDPSTVVPIDTQIEFAIAHAADLKTIVTLSRSLPARMQFDLQRKKACADAIVDTLRWVKLCGLRAVHPPAKPEEAANG